MNDIDINAIRQREQAATEGPWPEPELDESEFAWVVMNGKVGMPECAIAFVNTVCDRNAKADAEFIAAARTDLPDLLAKVDELTAALTERDTQLTAANRRADGAEADLRSAVKGNTAWANQRETFRAWDHCGPGGASNPHPLHHGKTCEQYDQAQAVAR